MTALAPVVILRSTENELNQMLILGSDSKCFGEIGQLQSVQLPVWTILYVNTVNIA